MLLVVGLALFWIGSAQPSVHDIAVFQLAGTPNDSGTGAFGGDDWINICTTDAPNVKTGCLPGTGDSAHRVGSTFDYDAHAAGPAGSGLGACPANPVVYAPGNNCTTFTGGGSKDDQDIPNWAWNDASGGLPAKDNIEQGYSARYLFKTDLTQPVTPTDTQIHINNTKASWFSSGQQNAQAGPPGHDYHIVIDGESMLVTGGQNTDTLTVQRFAGATSHAAGTDKVVVSLLYFGGTRFSNNGDAQIGFWFLQRNVALGTSKVGGGTGFSGVHRDGDILILSNFTNGGTAPTIEVWEWITGGGNLGNTNLFRLFPGTSASCIAVGSVAPVGTDSPTCAAVNANDGVASPWTFTNKGGKSTFDANEFYEGGLNLSAFPNIAGECFGTFLIETRSSQSTTATLKDFLLGPLQKCQANVSTQASNNGTVNAGSSVTDTATVTGATDSTLGPPPTGNVDFWLCGPAASASAALCTEALDSNGNVTGASNGTLKSTKPLNGTDNPSSVTSDAVNTSLSPLDAGSYCFLAVYRPGTDPNYGPSPDGNVSSSGQTMEVQKECFTVSVPTTTTTRQYVYPQDKAKIVASSGGNLAGTVYFRLYNSAANCALDVDETGGTPSPTGLLFSTSQSVSAASPVTKDTGNQITAAVTTSTTVYWHVFYVSTNPLQASSSRGCNESTQATFAGDDSDITVP